LVLGNNLGFIFSFLSYLKDFNINRFKFLFCSDISDSYRVPISIVTVPRRGRDKNWKFIFIFVTMRKFFSKRSRFQIIRNSVNKKRECKCHSQLSSSLRRQVFVGSLVTWHNSPNSYYRVRRSLEIKSENVMSILF
jgi:hypothetical protein